MKKRNLKKRVIIRGDVTYSLWGDEEVINNVVIRRRRHSNEEDYYLRTGNGRKWRKLRKLTSEESAQLRAKAPTEPETTTSISTTTSHLNKETIIDEEPKRQICWRKFRTEISKIGGINVYMKSRHKNTIIERILLKYPDFIRGIKLYEEGSKGVWDFITQERVETVRHIYERYFMDINQFLF